MRTALVLLGLAALAERQRRFERHVMTDLAEVLEAAAKDQHRWATRLVGDVERAMRRER